MKSKQLNQAQEKKTLNGSKQSQKEQEEAVKQKSTSLIDYIEIKESPFTIVDQKDKGIMVVMGQNLMAKDFKTVKEAQAWVARKPWQLILTAASAYVEFIKELKNEQ